MELSTSNRVALIILLAVVAAFLFGRTWGDLFFDNDWSFSHWNYLPVWYPILWTVVSAALGVLFVKHGTRIAGLFRSHSRVVVAGVILFAVLFLFQYDSFLYGGGNLRVGQVAQAERVLLRWYEYGSVLTVSLLDSFYDRSGIHYNAAGVYAWRTFSFVCMVLSLLGSARLAHELTIDPARRLLYFIIIFFGPQTLVYFGFIGIEPVVAAVSIWFAVAAVRLDNRYSIPRLIELWLILIIGVFFHFTSLYLLPAAVFLTIRGEIKNLGRHAIAAVVALGVCGGLLAAAHIFARTNLEFSKFILFVDGKLPHSDYGLFSERHISDVVQLLFLTFPLAALLLYLLIAQVRSRRTPPGLTAPLLMTLGGLITVVTLDPVHSIVLDVPRLATYLTPLAVVLAILIKRVDQQRLPLLTAFFAVTALMLPLSVLPGYVRIARADPYVTAYFDRHESFYLAGCLAFRDAYFYREKLDKANAWEWKLSIKSPDYLNIEGVKSLSQGGEDAEALRTLYGMIAKHPYWAEPRSLFAMIQLKLGRPELAGPQIDTCLMLEPYGKQHWKNLYRCYREKGSYARALETMLAALELFPGDQEIKNDLMIMYYRSGALRTADSLATELTVADSTRPYPYFIKGIVAERLHDTLTAIEFYTKFSNLRPDSADLVLVENRLSNLQGETEPEE